MVAGKKTIYKSITLSEPITAVTGPNAIARHIFSAETEAGGKPATARVGVLQVWQKQPGGWNCSRGRLSVAVVVRKLSKPV